MKTIIAAAMFVFFSVSAVCETTERMASDDKDHSFTRQQGFPGLGLAGVAYKSTFLENLKGLYDFSAIFYKRNGYFDTGTPNTILFIVQSTNLTVGDAAIRARLETLGHTVNVIAHTAALHPVSPSGIDLVFISQSVSVSNIADKYKNYVLPVVLCNAGLLPQMGMTGTVAGVDYGSTGSQRRLNFVNPGHPVGQGLAGDLEVNSSTRTYQWGVPATSAFQIAHLTNNPQQYGIFGYEQAALLADATISPNKRGFLWLHGNSFPAATETGRVAFDQMIAWALTENGNNADNEPPSVPQGLSASSLETSGFLLSWQPSTDNVGVSGYNVYINGSKANPDIIAGTSWNVSGLTPNTTYAVSVSAVDFTGNESGQSATINVTTLPFFQKNILFIVSRNDLIAGDSAIFNYIVSMGHTVSTMVHTPSLHPVAPVGIDLILISQSVTASNITDKYKNYTLPVVLCHADLLPSMGMTSNSPGTGFGATASQRRLVFTNSGHPVGQGLIGDLEVTSSTRTFQWGAPASGAVQIAHLRNLPQQFGIFVYEPGAILADASLATGKRGFLWLHSNAFTATTLTGKQAFANMINWALEGNEAPPDNDPPTIPQGLNATALNTTGFTLNWQASTDNMGVAGYNVFINGAKANNEPIPGTSWPFINLMPYTVYSVRVSAVDLAGNESALSQPLEVTTLPLKNILFIVGATTLNSGDNAIKNRLEAKGYALQLIDHTPALHPANVAGMDMVLISATVTSGNIVNKYKNTNLPVITFEPYMLDDMAMTGPTATVDYGDILNQTQLDFIAPNHPITLGLSGNITVNDPSRRFVWGVPGGQSFNLALIAGSPNRSAAFVYEQGATLVDNTAATHKRGFLWLFDDTFTSLSASGLSVFDNMMEWGLGNLIVPDLIPPTVPNGLSASNLTVNSFTLSWQPATDNVGVTGYDIYQNGTKINPTPITGTSLPITGLAAGTTYQMTVVALDGAGNASAPSVPLGVTTLSPVQPKTILFIVGSTTLNQGDNAIRNRLIASGYTVNLIAHTSSLHPASLSGIDLVLISASVAPGNLTNKYKASNVPIIILEPFILGNMGMTGNTAGTHYGEIDNQTQLNFVNPTHPVSDALSGLQSMSTVERRFVWGVPNSNATTIARIEGSSDRAGIFMYNAGVLMPDNSLSLNKRGFMWIWDNTFFTATTTAQLVFDRMIQWGVGTLGTGDVQSPSIPTGLNATDVQSNTFTLNWQPSTDNVGVTGYDVFRNGNKINTTPVTGTSFGVTLLQPNTVYQMSVRALDAAGNQSAQSEVLFVTTLPLPGTELFTMRTVIASQSSPWDIAWGPDNQIWYTERTAGRVSRVNTATGTKQVLLTLGSNMVQSAGQDGLMGMSIHPEFNTGKPFVYIAYTYQSLSSTVRRTRIQRYTFNSTTQVLESPVTVLEDIPGSNDHNAGRMTIGPDMKLYYSVGDMGAGQFDNATRPNNAQAANILEGKVLRLNLETSGGSWIPTDNPFTDGGSRTAVFSLGHRNPQGLVWGNAGGQNRLYSTEHGPFSDDEVNIISSGANYGWPQVIGFCDGNYNGRTTGGFTIVNEATNCSTLGSTQPIFSMFAVPTPPTSSTSSTTWPSVAASGMDFYGQTAIPNWQHSLLIAGLKSGSIIRLKLNSAGTSVIGDTVHYFRGMGRFRDVIVSPDGTKIYAACDNSGSTSGPTGGVVSTPPNPGSILEFSFNSGTAPASMITLFTADDQGKAKENTIRAYPNPAKGHLMVQIEQWTDAREIVLVTIDGKPAKQAMVTARETRVPLGNLGAGLYILRVTGKDGRNMGTEKVMVIQ
jgi:glucose/arabinose dehydrogenase